MLGFKRRKQLDWLKDNKTALNKCVQMWLDMDAVFRGGSRKISDWFPVARMFSLAAASTSAIERFTYSAGAG